MVKRSPSTYKALGSVDNTDMGEGGKTTNLAMSAKFLSINESYDIINQTTTEAEILQPNSPSLVILKGLVCIKGWKKENM